MQCRHETNEWVHTVSKTMVEQIGTGDPRLNQGTNTVIRGCQTRLSDIRQIQQTKEDRFDHKVTSVYLPLV